MFIRRERCSREVQTAISSRRKIVSLLLCLLMVLSLAGCSKPAQSGDASQDEQAASRIIDYRIADKEEGTELLLANKEYYDGFTQNDLEYRMHEHGAKMEDYLAFSKEQVLDFTDEHKAIVDKYVGMLEETIEERGYKLPELDQIVYICTTMLEECDVAAYTHGTQIYIDNEIFDGAVSGERDDSYMKFLFAHELFHCLTRSDPEFREEMYKIIHFTVGDKDYKLPPSVEEYFISNPDVEHHNSYATFMIDGEPVDCFTAFVTTKHMENKEDRFFDYGTTALVPVDGSDRYWLPEDASNFDEVFGRNTGYVIDPEECLADNFGNLLTYGMDGPDGKGYPDPEIVQAIDDYLKKAK